MKKALKDFFKKLWRNVKGEAKKSSKNLIADGIINSIFYHRHTTPINHYYSERWFKNLNFQKEIFRSSNNILTGYYYHNGNITQDKIIIFSCGYAKGVHYYLDFINYLTRNGYLVFSYDNTATDASEGKGIKGFPQAIIDLEAAIEFVKKDKNVKDEDLILIGHDMGGYAAGAIAKDHKNISKVVLISAFNSGSDLLKLNGREWAKEDMKPYLKYIDHHMEKSFPVYARYTVSKSMRYSHAKFLVIQSDSDILVPMSVGIDLYKKNLPNWKRINYKLINERSHDEVYYSNEGRAYRKKLIKEIKNLENESKNAPLDDRKLTALSKVVDKDLYSDLLDKNLMEGIINFIQK